MTVLSMRTPASIELASPTLIEALRECGLKVALSRVGGGRGPSNPWARLGSASHKVLEAAALQQLGDGIDDFDQRFTVAWQSAIGLEEAESTKHPTEARWGAPRAWPSYADKRARTRRRARELAHQVAKWHDADIRVEEFLSSEEDRLFGKPDLIVRSPLPHRIIDYKTGGVTEGAEGDLKSSYRRQLLLYAQLERRATPGDLPTHLAVVPLRGEPIDFQVDWAEVEAAVADAAHLIDWYNAERADPLSLARPSPRTCGSCQFAAGCPAMWDAVGEGWAAELVAVGGTLIDVIIATDGSVTLRLSTHMGTLAGGDVLIKRLPVATSPELQHAQVGQQVRFVGGRIPEGEEGTIWPSSWSRIAFE